MDFSWYTQSTIAKRNAPMSSFGSRRRRRGGDHDGNLLVQDNRDSVQTANRRRRIERLADAAQVELRWRPFLLGPIFKAYGWNDSPFNIYAAKGRYMWRDLQRICDAEGLPLKLPPMLFPQKWAQSGAACIGR
jgi:DSBA-like thioredoxin domain